MALSKKHRRPRRESEVEGTAKSPFSKKEIIHGFKV